MKSHHELLGERLTALLPEPSAAEKQAARKAAFEEQFEVKRDTPAFPVLALGTLVRSDVYGFRGHDAKVLRDDGPAENSDRKVTIEKVTGRRAGEIASLSRSRVKPVPGC